MKPIGREGYVYETKYGMRLSTDERCSQEGQEDGSMGINYVLAVLDMNWMSSLGSCFIKRKDMGILEQCSSQAKELALTDAKILTSFLKCIS